MIAIFVPYEIKWRVFGITFGRSHGVATFQFKNPWLSLPHGVVVDEPMKSVGRGVQMGLKVEAV